MTYSFSWNGTSCRNKGIVLRTAPEIVKPEERVSHVVIPGRAGELTIAEGTDIYNSYIQTLTMIAEDPAKLAEAEKWLRGDGYVTFSVQPTLKQRARVINAVNFTKLSHNLNRWSGDVQFYCDPLKEQITEEAVEVTSSGSMAKTVSVSTVRFAPKSAVPSSVVTSEWLMLAEPEDT